MKTKLYPELKAIQKLLWLHDDRIDQDTLFEVQDRMAALILKVAQEEGKTDNLLKDFGFLYNVE